MKTIILLFIANFFACVQTAPVLPATVWEEDQVLEIMWASRMDFEKEIVNLNNGISYKDWYVYSGDLDFPPTLMGFNKSTGVKEWQIAIDAYQEDEIVKSYLLGDILIARTTKRVLAFNLERRELIWTRNLHEEGIRLGASVIGANGKYYLEADFGFNTGQQVQHLYEFDIYNGEHSIIVSYSEDALGVKSISPPVIWKDEQGEEYAIFNFVPNAQDPPGRMQQYLKAVHIATKEEHRSIAVTTAFASNILHAPIVEEGTIITGADWSMYAFDINTGAQLWRYAFDYPWGVWTKTNHLLYDGRLYVNNSQENVTCLDPKTGELIWSNPKGGPNCTDNMIYYDKEDLLVFTSWGYGSVMILDALSGTVIHREHRYDDSQFNNDIVYDEERDLFFTSTFKHAVGFRIQRPN